jgi:hypothetical protein
MPTARAGLAAVTYQGKIYAVGGYVGSDYLNAVEVFDPATGRWTTASSMNEARSNLRVVARGDTLYAIGGTVGSGALSTVESFTPATGRWEVKRDMNYRPEHFSAIVTQDAKIIVVGTIITQHHDCSNTSWCQRAVTVVDEYDPSLDVWTEKTSMDQGDSEELTTCNKLASSLDAVSYGGAVYVVGFYEKICGGGPHPVPFWTPIRAKYHPDTDTWEKDSFAAPGKAKTGYSFTSFADRLFLAGGLLRYGESPIYYFQKDDTVDSLDPVGDVWAAEPNLGTFRSEHGASVAGNNLYFIGGKDGDTFLGTMEHIAAH